MCEYVRTRVLRLLGEREEMTIVEMVANSNMKRSTLERTMTELHRGNQVHIADWRPTAGGQYCAVWGGGKDEDAPKPTAGVKRRSDPVKAIIRAISSLELTPFRTAMWNVERAAR